LASTDTTLSKAAVSACDVATRFRQDRRGVVAVAVAILLPVLIGFAGLGVEVGMWFAIQRQNQSAADAAAISAGLEYAAQIQRGVATDSAAAIAAATTAANCNWFSTSSSSSNPVCPPPSSTSNTITVTGTPNAVQVVLTQPLNTTFANLVTAIWGPNVDTVTVTTSATAAFAAGTACFLAVDASSANAFLVDNGGTLPNKNCWAASNSSSGRALNCNGCTIDGPTNVVGGEAVSNGGQLNGSPNRTYASATADPYASVSVAGFPVPGNQCALINPVTTQHITHGHYCGIQLTNNQTLWLDDSGEYYFDGKFDIQSGSTLNAAPPGGVTIIINGTYCLGDGSCLPGHGIGGMLNVTAQTTGTFAGIAIFGPRDSDPKIIQEFANGSLNNIKGAIYFPSQTIHFAPNSQLNSSFCTQIIGRQIHIENNASVSNSCNGISIRPISILEVYLSS
jgi:Flp pilus assembly protein TadG